jgi:hypothetical protein
MHSIWVWILSFFVWLSADADLIKRETARAAAAGAATEAVFAVDEKPAPKTPAPAPAPSKNGTTPAGPACPGGVCPKPATPARK